MSSDRAESRADRPAEPEETPDGAFAMPDSIRISSRSRGLLSMLKSRTGLQQTSSARLAFCLSVADPTIPDASTYDENGPELRTSDVFGGGGGGGGGGGSSSSSGCTDAYAAILAHAVRDGGGGAGPDAASDFLRAHVNRGIVMLFSRARSISDVGLLVAGADHAGGSV